MNESFYNDRVILIVLLPICRMPEVMILAFVSLWLNLVFLPTDLIQSHHSSSSGHGRGTSWTRGGRGGIQGRGRGGGWTRGRGGVQGRGRGGGWARGRGGGWGRGKAAHGSKHSWKDRQVKKSVKTSNKKSDIQSLPPHSAAIDALKNWINWLLWR